MNEVGQIIVRDNPITRRQVLLAGAAAGLGALAMSCMGRRAFAQEQPTMSDRQPFPLCLNTGTIRGQKLSLVQEIGQAPEGCGAGDAQRHRLLAVDCG
jgi:hypothetical protein